MSATTARASDVSGRMAKHDDRERRGRGSKGDCGAARVGARLRGDGQASSGRERSPLLAGRGSERENRCPRPFERD